MRLTGRDRKILFVLLFVGVAAGAYLLLFKPKMDERAKLANDLTAAQSAATAAESRLGQLRSARASFANSYATVIRLGKSIPASVDMPSVLLQLYTAARGTGLNFLEFKVGPRASASASPGSKSVGVAVPSGSAALPPTSWSGAQTATAAATGAASSAGATASGSSPITGLDSVPLDFTFRGDFFHLANFFHAVKRFVHVAGDRIDVNGRLLDINSFNFDDTQQPYFPTVTAKIHATIYLAPKSQGVNAGATPAGPATATPASTPPSTGGSSGSSTPAPAASVTR